MASDAVIANDLKQNTKIVLEELWREVSIKEVTDMADIMSYGVMSTPALVIDGG